VTATRSPIAGQCAVAGVVAAAMQDDLTRFGFAKRA